MTHLNALEVRLSHERVRLAKAKTENERALRRVWVAGIEKEIAGERKFLGLVDEAHQMSDEELMEALS
jgi:hypothetical protein